MAAALQTLILVIPWTSGVFKVSSLSLQDCVSATHLWSLNYQEKLLD